MPKVVLAGSNGLPYPALKSIVKNTADVVLFGDSVMERVSRHDEDRRSLGQMITERLAPVSVLTISRSAHNPDIYLPLLRAMAKVRHSPNTIIIPINMRCFSPQWELSPDWQFEQEKAMIARYLRWRWTPIKPIFDVQYDANKHAMFDNEPAFYEMGSYRRISDFKTVIASEPSRDRSSAIFTYHYTHRLTSSNKRLQNLVECVSIAKSIARKVLVYVTPINMEALNRFVGPAGSRIAYDNAETVQAAIGHDRFESWIDALRESHFFSEDLATEHLNENGRKQLSQLIVSLLNSLDGDGRIRTEAGVRE